MNNRNARRYLALLALATSLATQAAAQDSAPSVDQRPWLIAGPFPFEAVSGLENSLDRDYLAATGMVKTGEAAASPSRVTSPTLKSWREDSGIANGEGVNFIAAFGRISNSVAYAYREVYAESPRHAVLKIGSDDGVKVWVNGELVLTNYAARALSADEDAVTVSLSLGKNKILVKVAQIEGDWGFLLHIVTLDEEAKAAGSANLARLAVYPDALAFPQGGVVGGVAMTKPAFCIEGSAKLRLIGSRGESLGSTDVSIGGRFAIPIPTGFGGPARLEIAGKGGLTGLAPGSAALLIGDAGVIAAQNATRARRAAVGAASNGPAFDIAATLELIAQELEGSLEPSLGSFACSIAALTELEALSPPEGKRPATFIPGLARFAYQSTVDGSLQPYSLYLPRSYDASKRYGLVVALHGATGNDFEMASSLATAEPKDMLIVAPLGRGDLGYASTGEKDVLDVMDLVLSRYSVDPDRVYLTGRSMGGYGTWKIGQLYPWRFAAIASFAGWTSLDCLDNLISVPVLAVHGDADPTIPIEPEAKAVALLKSLGGNARLDILPGVGHGALESWIAKEGAGRLFAWFRSFKRISWPQSMKIRTMMARVGKGSWASILGLAKPRVLAALDARIVDSRHVAVDTENVSAFSLDLRHPSLAKGGRILILADGVNLTADSGSASARFELGADGRFTSASPADLLNGGSGIAALYAGATRIVYGARKHGAAADNAAVAKILSGRADERAGAGRENEGKAETASRPGDRASSKSGDRAAPGDSAAPKSASISRFFSRLEILPDASLTPEAEASSSLILVGWPDENAVVSRLEPKLPIRITGSTVSLPSEGVSGSGFILCLPNPEASGRLVAIIALPSHGKQALDFARAILISLRANSGGRGEAGFASPDLIILDRSGALVWAGCYDWKWDKLTKLYASER